MRMRTSLAFLFSVFVLSTSVALRADDEAQPVAQSSEESNAANSAVEKSELEAHDSAPTPKSAPAPRKKGRHLEKADAFIAPADWEFDGFVAGGQDQEIRSLYYLND